MKTINYLVYITGCFFLLVQFDLAEVAKVIMLKKKKKVSVSSTYTEIFGSMVILYFGLANKDD